MSIMSREYAAELRKKKRLKLSKDKPRSKMPYTLFWKYSPNIKLINSVLFFLLSAHLLYVAWVHHIMKIHQKFGWLCILLITIFTAHF